MSEVQLIEGDAVWKAGDEGRWSESLATAAMRAAEGKDVSSLRDFVEPADGKTHNVHAILIKYRDGLRATVLRIGKSATRWCFACRVQVGKLEPLANQHVCRAVEQSKSVQSAVTRDPDAFSREARSLSC